MCSRLSSWEEHVSGRHWFKEAERPMEQTHLKLGANPGPAKHRSTHRRMKKKYVVMKIGMIMSFGWFVTQYYGSNS